jgi:peptide/nickel transport system substrate-binding protein
MDRYLLIKKGHSGFWIGFIDVGSTKALDKYTVRFYLTKPSNAFIPSLTKFFVMNKKLLLQNKAEGPFGDYGDLGQAWISQGHDAGSGPYMIVSYSPDIGAELVKFNDYWKGWKPNQVDRIKFMVITEEATIKMLLINKELEMGHAFLSPTTYLTLGKIAYLNLSYGPSINWEPICMNTRKPPLDDVHVRRAIAYAINYTELVNTVFPGAIVGSSLLAPGVFGHDPSIPKFEMNLTKAEEELAQSSYTREQLSQFTLECDWLSGQDADRMVAVALQSACARIGINVEVVSVLWSQMLDRATKPQTTPHFSIWEPWSRYPDPDYYVYSVFHSSQQGRWITQHWFFTDELDALCELQRSTINSTERQIALKQIQQIVRDNIPIIFVCYRPYYNIRQNYVQGWKYIPYHAWEYWIYRLTIVR